MSEHLEQVAVIKWADIKHIRIFSVPNGGHRHRMVAIKLKMEGVRAGVPDLVIPYARNGYHALFIEMKFGKNRITPEQKNWISWLNGQKYLAVVCYGADAAIKAIEVFFSDTSVTSEETKEKLEKLIEKIRNLVSILPLGDYTNE